MVSRQRKLTLLCPLNFVDEPRSKRQFSRKILEWGFRKNVSRSERCLILQHLPQLGQDPVLEFDDHRFKPGKLNNWRRRYWKERLVKSRQRNHPRNPHCTSHGAHVEVE